MLLLPAGGELRDSGPVVCCPLALSSSIHVQPGLTQPGWDAHPELSERSCMWEQSNGASTGQEADPFLGSLALYLQTHQFQNAIAGDFLTAFDDFTGTRRPSSQPLFTMHTLCLYDVHWQVSWLNE